MQCAKQEKTVCVFLCVCLCVCVCDNLFFVFYLGYCIVLELIQPRLERSS